MKIFSEITHKWYKTPGECLEDEELHGKANLQKVIDAKKNEAVNDLVIADKMVQLADAAMLVAADAIIEVYDLGGEMPKINDLPFNNPLTLLQTLKGIRQKIELISIMKEIERGSKDTERAVPDKEDGSAAEGAEADNKGAVDRVKAIVRETVENLNPESDDIDQIPDIPEDWNVVLFPSRGKNPATEDKEEKAKDNKPTEENDPSKE